MNDRELLELAAKAAGEPYFEHAPEGGLYLSNGDDWNPLEDDGDALRLAVKLNMSIAVGVAMGDAGASTEFDLSDNDPYAATRRAIVRAAAEIGKSLCDASIGRNMK